MTTNVVPNKPIGNVIPAGNSLVDPVSGIGSTLPHAKYSVLSTSGTTTINPGPCVCFGALTTVLATSTGSLYLLDGTTVITSTLTATAVGMSVQPGFYSVGVRCLTSLVAIAAGTNANTYNILWD